MRKRLLQLSAVCLAVVFVIGLTLVDSIRIPVFWHPRPVHAASSFATIVCDNFSPYSSAASAQAIAAGGANNFIYVCNFGFGSIGGSSFSIVEGTGTTCATNTKAMFGGTTAATGAGLAANATFEEGSGVGAVLKTQVAGDNVCVISSGTGPLAGNFASTQAPY